jgi:multicomponent Na+:H+ antiporter subunit C
MLIFILFCIGFYGLCVGKTVIKSIFNLMIAQSALLLLFFQLVYSPEAAPPIIGETVQAVYVDPYPQALMITTIVIGASITSLAMMFSIKIYHHYGTLTWKKFMHKD